MKKFFFPLVLLLTYACSTSTKNMTIGALTLPAHPKGGDLIKLEYALDSSAGAKNKDQTLTLYYGVEKEIYAQSVPLSDTTGALQAQFTLPDSAQAFALKFGNGKTQAIEDKGSDTAQPYIFPVYDNSDAPIAGARIAMSQFYNGLGQYLLGGTANPDMALQLIETDFSAHPELKGKWRNLYLSTLLQVKEDSAYPEVEQALQEVLAGDSVTADDYQMAMGLYARMKMRQKADSLKMLGAKRFPESRLAKLVVIQRFNDQKSVDSMSAYYESIKQQFPEGNSRMNDIMAGRIAGMYAEQGNYTGFKQMVAAINNPLQKAGTYNSVAWKLAEAGKDLSFADSISKMSLDLIQKSMDQPGEEKPVYLTEQDWNKRMQQRYAMYADTYALLRFKEGKTKDALAYQSKAMDYSEGMNVDMNERYVQYLIASGGFKKAQTQLEKSFAEGRTTAKMDTFLKKVYVHQNKSVEGYADYLAGLEAKATAKMKEALAKELIDQPAPDFVLPDLKGGKVSLAALKGKVVIVDFWATWCGPCKASFPGMQQAVRQFSQDSNVVFLFVNTWERTAREQRYEQVSQFIAKNKYDFHVLMDQPKTDDSTQFKVIGDYEVRGIPTKFIIGPEGHIRFKKVGFGGSAAAEAKEISMMIEMAGA